MNTSEKGINLIKGYEQCRLYAYRDSVGVLTIGWGHIKNVYAGQAITQQQADEFLKQDLAVVEKVINDTGLKLSQNQFDALVSWIYNLGAGALYKSTMYKYLKEGRNEIDVTDQLVKWHNAGGKPLLGLKRRRVSEANMFLGRELYYVNKGEKIVKK